jgi:hypothetical protein
MDVQHRNIILDMKVLEDNIYLVFLKQHHYSCHLLLFKAYEWYISKHIKSIPLLGFHNFDDGTSNFHIFKKFQATHFSKIYNVDNDPALGLHNGSLETYINDSKQQ